jgi:lysozyme
MANKSVVLMLCLAAAVLLLLPQDEGGTDDAGDSSGDDESNVFLDTVDTIMEKIDEGVAILSGPGPVADMCTSEAAKRMMRASESCRLVPYNLNDGGWTAGWGHQYTRYETVPASITQAQADSMFEDDVVNRGESKVKLYIKVPLTQNQFDAIVDISYGLSVKGFKKFADNVNAGNGIDSIAQSSVAWVAPIYANGIRNRRNRQVAMFNNGVYA